MLILIEDTERGFDIAKGLWGAFNSCLYIDEGYMDSMYETIDYLIGQCAKSGVTFIFVTSNIERLKKRNPQAFCIHCDGGDMEDENDRALQI